MSLLSGIGLLKAGSANIIIIVAISAAAVVAILIIIVIIILICKRRRPKDQCKCANHRAEHLTVFQYVAFLKQHQQFTGLGWHNLLWLKRAVNFTV